MTKPHLIEVARMPVASSKRPPRMRDTREVSVGSECSKSTKGQCQWYAPIAVVQEPVPARSFVGTGSTPVRRSTRAAEPTVPVEGGSTETLRRLHLLLARFLLGMVGLQIGLAMLGIPLVVHGALGLVVWLLALAVGLL